MIKSKLFSDVITGRAISIRQPYVEDILRGKKKFEYRSRPTQIRGRVFLYASLGPGNLDYWKKMKLTPGSLPTGLVVGSVEIVDCLEDGDGGFKYKLKDPKRYKTTIKPKSRPQPCFFFPFGTLLKNKKDND